MHIFISYAKKDTRDLALDLHAALSALPGVSAWVDTSLKPGRGWAREIEKQIRRCDWMIVLISPDVNREGTETQDESFVLNEIEYARSTAKKPILPVMAQYTAMPVELATVQYINFAGESGAGIAWLVEQICAGIGIAVDPPQPDPARVPEPMNAVPEIVEDVAALIDQFLDVHAAQEWEAARNLLRRIGDLDDMPSWFDMEGYEREVLAEVRRLEAERQRREAAEAAAAREYPLIRKLAGRDPVRAWEALRVFRATYPFYGDPDGLVPKLNPFHLLPPFEWIDIPAGMVTLEDASRYEGTSGGRYEVAAFKIAKYPITNAQYDVFVNDPQGYANPVWWEYSPEARAWRGEHPKSPDTHFPGSDLPRTIVSWYDAVAFCRWLTARLNGFDSSLPETPPPPPPHAWGGEKGEGLSIMLPTEQQWQRAAQGDDGREYPWGNRLPDETLCNFGQNVGCPTPVTQYPAGASPYGVLDMSGNVWEWCLTEWGTDAISVSRGSPRVLRGGSWLSSNSASLRAANRYWVSRSSRDDYVGFRCTRS